MAGRSRVLSFYLLVGDNKVTQNKDIEKALKLNYLCKDFPQ
jgi:hypothetical protein